MHSSDKITSNNNIFSTGDSSAGMRLDPGNTLPDELILLIFSHLALQDLGSCDLVNRSWNRFAKDKSLSSVVLFRELKEMKTRNRFIGAHTWKKYIGDVGKVPPLPKNILQTLLAPCPWKNLEKTEDGLKVKDTHVFGLIPRTVNGEPLTLNSIGDFVKTPKGEGYPTKYRHIWNKIITEHGDICRDESYWALMTSGELDGSRGKRRAEQLALAKQQTGYQAPTLAEAVFFNFLLYVREKERLFSDNPWTYTCCQETLIDGSKLIVGGFVPASLDVRYYYDDYDNYVGVVALRRF